MKISILMIAFIVLSLVEALTDYSKMLCDRTEFFKESKALVSIIINTAFLFEIPHIYGDGKLVDNDHCIICIPYCSIVTPDGKKYQVLHNLPNGITQSYNRTEEQLLSLLLDEEYKDFAAYVLQVYHTADSDEYLTEFLVNVLMAFHIPLKLKIYFKKTLNWNAKRLLNNQFYRLTEVMELLPLDYEGVFSVLKNYKITLPATIYQRNYGKSSLLQQYEYAAGCNICLGLFYTAYNSEDVIRAVNDINSMKEINVILLHFDVKGMNSIISNLSSADSGKPKSWIFVDPKNIYPLRNPNIFFLPAVSSQKHGLLQQGFGMFLKKAIFKNNSSPKNMSARRKRQVIFDVRNDLQQNMPYSKLLQGQCHTKGYRRIYTSSLKDTDRSH